MTTTLALAARLRGLDDAVLASLLDGRTYRRTGVADFFDLADALFDADSLQRALAPLDRIHLAALVVLGRAATPLTADEVSALLAAEPATAGVHRDAVAASLDDLAAVLLVEPAEGCRVRRLRRRDRPARRVARAAAALGGRPPAHPATPRARAGAGHRAPVHRPARRRARVRVGRGRLRAARRTRARGRAPAAEGRARAARGEATRRGARDRRRVRSGGSLGRRPSGPGRGRRGDVAPDRRRLDLVALPQRRPLARAGGGLAGRAPRRYPHPPGAAEPGRVGRQPARARRVAVSAPPSTRRSGGWMRTRDWPNGSA